MSNPWNAWRWFLRRNLRRLRRNSDVTPAAAREILYLFSGTYGDFVQILRPLRALADAMPRARIRLLASAVLVRDFRRFLPTAAERVGYFGALRHCAAGADFLVTNAVGVYRVRFDVLACLGGRLALGFRHAEEKERKAYTKTIPLTSAIRNFEEANFELLGWIGVHPTPTSAGFGHRPLPSGGEGETKESSKLGGERILFHVGSIGFKRDLGLERYLDLLRQVLRVLEERVEEILYGSGDEDVIEGLRRDFPGHRFVTYDLAALADRVRKFSGRIVCVNSFFAHFCRYLGKPAVVIHRGRVPYGYDCDPLHVQIVLPAEGPPWDLSDLRRALSV